MQILNDYLFPMFIVTISTYIICVIVSVNLLWSNYKYYKTTYTFLELGFFDYHSLGDVYYSFNQKGGLKCEIIKEKYFNRIKLVNGKCLHNDMLLIFDLYSLYWYRKIFKLAENYIDNKEVTDEVTDKLMKEVYTILSKESEWN